MKGQHSTWHIFGAKQIFVKGRKGGRKEPGEWHPGAQKGPETSGLRTGLTLAPPVGKTVPADGECLADLLSAIDEYIL